MKKIILTLCLIILPTLACLARAPYRGGVTVTFEKSVKSGEIVTLRADIDPSILDPGRNGIVTFTPTLRALDGSREVTFDRIYLSGKRRAKSIRREERLSKLPPVTTSESFVVLTRTRDWYIPLEYTVAFEPWMRQSEFVIVEQTASCCNDLLLYEDGRDYKIYSGGPNAFAEPYRPAFEVAYITPDVEEVKIQSETYSARLQFQVNKSELLRGFADNARILAEADEMIDRVKNDTLLTIRRIMVKGYASPEGNTASNMTLSQNRAQAFVGYLHGRHNFFSADRIITAEGLGEDWTGLRKAVDASSLDDKYKVLDILDNPYEVNRRKNELKALNGGRTYRTLLSELYPPLRRNEYTIEYEVRGFNEQDALTVYRTRPQLLSLNEFFMVANLYEHNSEEFKKVFDIAARIFPDSPVAQCNAAATEIENGSYDTAIHRLENLDSPQVLNNLGIAYWHKGDYEKAEQYLRRSASEGYDTAGNNVSEYEKWSEERE